MTIREIEIAKSGTKISRSGTQYDVDNNVQPCTSTASSVVQVNENAFLYNLQSTTLSFEPWTLTDGDCLSVWLQDELWPASSA